MPSAIATTRPPLTDTRVQRAKALFARLRHKQLLTAMSGRITESAVYAQRALRVRREVCNCTA
jgi:hypothetical protein